MIRVSLHALAVAAACAPVTATAEPSYAAMCKAADGTRFYYASNTVRQLNASTSIHASPLCTDPDYGAVAPKGLVDGEECILVAAGQGYFGVFARPRSFEKTLSDRHFEFGTLGLVRDPGFANATTAQLPAAIVARGKEDVEKLRSTESAHFSGWLVDLQSGHRQASVCSAVGMARPGGTR